LFSSIKVEPVTATKEPRTPFIIERTSIFLEFLTNDMIRERRPPPNEETIVVTVAFLSKIY